MIVDANILLYARNADDPRHDRAEGWLTAALNGSARVGLPWQTLGAFLRIATNPRALPRPLPPDVAWRQVTAWISAPAAWVPVPGGGYPRILGALVGDHAPIANLVPDAMLAALAIEHGVAIASSDADFARFRGLTWIDPLR